MEAKDLRIGNLVLNGRDNTIVKVESISNSGINLSYDTLTDELYPKLYFTQTDDRDDWIVPITLTEEWCDKLFKETNGFSHCKIWTLGKGFKLAMHKDHRGFSILHEKVSPPSWVIINLEYLHQLQNFCSLTGTELTIKV